MAQLPLLKLGGLLVKTIAKPVANRMKIEAKKHPLMMTSCVYIGQISHQITSRLNVLASGYKILGIKPLPEEDALARGVNFLSESFVFLVGGIIIVVEYNRSEEKSALKAQKEALKEADFLKRVTDAETKLARFEQDKGDFDDKTFDLDQRLKNVEKLAQYWAAQQMDDIKHEANQHPNVSADVQMADNSLGHVPVPTPSSSQPSPSTTLIIPPLQPSTDASSNNYANSWLSWLDWSKWVWSSPASSRPPQEPAV